MGSGGVVKGYLWEGEMKSSCIIEKLHQRNGEHLYSFSIKSSFWWSLNILLSVFVKKSVHFRQPACKIICMRQS